GLTIARPALHHVGPAVESVEEHFVLVAKQIEQEAIERSLGGGDLLAQHAAAGIERNTETHGYALRIELLDLLALPVFVELEVVRTQIPDEPALRIGHRGRDVNQLDAGAKREPLTARPLLARVGGA